MPAATGAMPGSGPGSGAGLLDRRDLAHLHLYAGEDGRLKAGYATLAGGDSTAIGLPFGDELESLYEAALAACPGEGDGRIVHGTQSWRLARYEATGGPALVLVRNPPVPDGLTDLGLPAPLAEQLVEVGRHGRGLVLLLGDMRSGKSTLAAGLVRQWLTRWGGQCFNWADPVEHDLEGPVGTGYCAQIEIDETRYRHAATVAAKRSRARYLYFGEPRRSEAMAAIVHASLLGPLCLTTAHGYSLTAGLTAYAGAVAETDPRSYHSLAAALTAVLHLRLEPGRAGALWDRLVCTESLIVGPDHGDTIRAQVRAGNIGQLGNHVKRWG